MQKILTLDYHGVVDKDPEFFSKLMRNWKSSNGMVHLVSGLGLEKLSEAASKFKSDYGVGFDRVFSIETRLLF